MEEVELDNAKALSLFNINQAQKGSYRFFETKARFAMLGNKPPTPAMISAWKTAIGKSQVVQPYRDDFDFFLNPPLRKNLQLPFVEPLALYAMIFFLGSLVRYHPDFLESLLASRDSWIIERFVKAAPISLLLFMRNLIHGEHFAYISR